MAAQSGFERHDVAVFRMKLRFSKDERRAAFLAGMAKRFQDGLPGGSEGVRVGDQYGRLVAELLPEYLWCAAKHALR